ncbi:MAG TPA: UvrD-helicase domain-containing protein, partial [Pirellulales bacterium]|nr:UvrD-helicase domain-containing protein [Pirellulales bacterium]
MAERRCEPPDQPCREQIASDLDRTLLVEAAAGTGKTTCLVARMVGLLREGKCRIETLAAVTYTRKAAAELRTRFQLVLETAAVQSPDKHRERRVEALKHVERCFIGTIHSFCARLLHERPVEAGVDPGFVELDQTVDDQLRRQAWREHVAALVATDDPLLPELERLGLKVSPATRRASSVVSELEELGLEPAELGPAFLQLAEYLDVDDWPAQASPLPDLKPCSEKLTAYAAHMRALSPQLTDPGNDKLMPKYDLIGRMVASLDLSAPAQLMEALEQFKILDRKNVVQRQWLGKGQALAELERFNDFTRQYAEPLLLAWREHRYEPVVRAILPARDIYERLRRECNGLNFQDLLLLSAHLLRDKPEVRRYFRQRFSHLLVDEFQDTDPIQAEVMLLLTADDCRERDWQACRPRPGSLFVVGDPKQSIYRFRRADMLTYGKVRSIITAAGGQVVPLTANFRSVSPLIEWVNACFREIFPPAANDFGPNHQALDVGRDDCNHDQASIQRLLVPADLKTYALAAEYEADLIARTIRRPVDERWPVRRTEKERDRGWPEHAQPGDFLIVARTRARLTIYARKLQAVGLPHSVTGGGALNEVPELELLHVCLSAVAKSDDAIALVAVLRSELFGVADTVLYDFQRAGGQFSYHVEVPADLDADSADVLRDAFERLRAYARWLRRLPAAAAIERIAADLGLIARARAAEEGDVRAGSLLKAIELLRAVDGQFTAGNLVEALGRLVEADDVHDGLSVRSPVESPVRVMNLHQCKGLEAPFMFLVDPSGETEHDVEVHIDRSAGRSRDFLPIYGPRRSEYGPRQVLAQPPGWRELAAKERMFLDAETNRLLYVAATRAGVKLVVSQREGNGNRRNPWGPFDVHLQTAGSFADPGAIPTNAAAPLTFDAGDWQKEVAAIDGRWRAVLRPTYAVQAV